MSLRKKHDHPSDEKRVGDACFLLQNTVDGKLKYGTVSKAALWPFATKITPQRSSRNRPAGMLETKPLSVVSEIYQEFMLKNVVPAIAEKWVGPRGKEIILQHDNAPPHKKGIKTN